MAKLTRQNGWIAGVCGGIAAWSGLPAILVRILFIALGVTIPLYLILWIIIPKQ